MFFVGRGIHFRDTSTEGLVFLQITPSERDALELLANGTTADEIACRLGVSVCDVEALLAALFAKMGTTTPLDAVAVAFRRGLLPAPQNCNAPT